MELSLWSILTFAWVAWLAYMVNISCPKHYNDQTGEYDETQSK
jgi:hypothetical protein